ncbi:hypothetical protein [Streptomyces sp. NPDC093808]|uniref:hypothetical protein n=1 Tax=unclassified Streptomyces TaxID=2593676 RepID=UPI00344CAF42
MNDTPSVRTSSTGVGSGAPEDGMAFSPATLMASSVSVRNSSSSYRRLTCCTSDASRAVEVRMAITVVPPTASGRPPVARSHHSTP